MNETSRTMTGMEDQPWLKVLWWSIFIIGSLALILCVFGISRYVDHFLLWFPWKSVLAVSLCCLPVIAVLLTIERRKKK